MGIRKFSDYDKTQGYKDFIPLPKGAYVARIMDASVHESDAGEYVKITADIAEGEFQGYYSRDYENQQPENRKWHCNFLLNIPKDDGSEKDGWSKRNFKTFINALEDSNPGYHFDWDETKFKGLLIGALFNEKEYVRADNSIGRSINWARVISVDRVRSGKYKLPEDKLLKKPEGGEYDNDGFMSVPASKVDDLPFD